LPRETIEIDAKHSQTLETSQIPESIDAHRVNGPPIEVVSEQPPILKQPTNPELSDNSGAAPYQKQISLLSQKRVSILEQDHDSIISEEDSKDGQTPHHTKGTKAPLTDTFAQQITPNRQ